MYIYICLCKKHHCVMLLITLHIDVAPTHVAVRCGVAIVIPTCRCIQRNTHVELKWCCNSNIHSNVAISISTVM